MLLSIKLSNIEIINLWERWDSNPGPLGAKRERYPLCYAAPFPQVFFAVEAKLVSGETSNDDKDHNDDDDVDSGNADSADISDNADNADDNNENYGNNDGNDNDENNDKDDDNNDESAEFLSQDVSLVIFPTD